MKSFFVFVLLVPVNHLCFSQLNYIATNTQNITGVYTDLGTSGSSVTTNFSGSSMTFDDDNSSIQNIGFSFTYNGTIFTQFVLNSNGFIKLGNIPPAANTYDVLSSSEMNVIAPFNYDLDAGIASAEYRVSTSGAAGTRICTIQFKNVREWTSPQQYNNINFQIKLYETSNTIDFIYGAFMPDQAVSPAPIDSYIGIKGSYYASSVNLIKNGVTNWSSSGFINGNSFNEKFRNQNNYLPDIGRTFRFIAAPLNDIGVVAAYALSKVPLNVGVPVIIKARVTNAGTTTFNNLPVSLYINGANSFTNSKQITLAPQTSTIVTFDAFSPTLPGMNNGYVSVPGGDDIYANDYKEFSQMTNYSTYSYADNSSPTGNLGWGTNAGLFLAKYHASGTTSISSVNVHLNPAANAGNTVYGILMNSAGTIIAQSAPYLTVTADLGQYKNFVFPGPVALTNTDFYVGLAQTANSATGYYPLSIQSELTPARPEAYYYSFGLGGGIPTEATGYGRFMIQAIVNTSGYPNSIITGNLNVSHYDLPNCSSTASDYIEFTSAGTFTSNIYTVQMFGGSLTAPINVGQLTSNVNYGIIPFTIPAGINGGFDFGLRVISSNPAVNGSSSSPFYINAGHCQSEPDDIYRSRTSGFWDVLSTWESSTTGSVWIPATLIPGITEGTEIRAQDTVTIRTPITLTHTYVNGTLRLVNNTANNGKIAVFDPGGASDMGLNINNVLQIISSSDSYPNVMSYTGGRIKVFGKIVVGDGVTPLADGFHGFATGNASHVRWFHGSTFEWNSSAGYGPVGGLTYFNNSEGHPHLKLTAVPAGAFGGSANTMINGFLDVNTPFTMTGSGIKTFADGIKGNSVLSQSPGSGEFRTLSPYAYIPADTSDPTSIYIGLLDGSVDINLSNNGLTLANGITVTDSANVSITGPSLSTGKIELQYGGRMVIDPGSLLTIDNSDLVNGGVLDGAGVIRFTGYNYSYLSSPGTFNPSLELVNKRLQLSTHTNTNSIKITGGGRLLLDSFNLNMGSASLVGDKQNFIVTNDTGTLTRTIASSPVIFHIGSDSTSYAPATIVNNGSPDNFHVRVKNDLSIARTDTTGNVKHAWIITDASPGGSINLKLTWDSTDEQPGFDREACYITRLSVCPPPINCDNGYYGPGTPTAAINNGDGSFSLERNNITEGNGTFIVTSGPFVYTFTGNGNWNDPNNWTPGMVPPSVIPAGVEVVIDHPAGIGVECFHNGPVTVKPNGKLTVKPDKKFRIVQ